jgi:hypothetical protein
MATTLTLSDLAKNAMLDALDTYVGSTATLEFQTAGGTEVATLTLTNPAFETAASGAMALDCNPDLTDSSATGNASAVTQFKIKVGGTTDAITGTVGTSGEAINFAGGTTFGAGDAVTLTEFTITMP